MTKLVKKRKYLAILSVASITLLSACGYFAYQAYQTYLATKIYGPSETVSTPDFDLVISNNETTPVSLPFDKAFASKYGGVDNKENCSVLSTTPTVFYVSGMRLTNGPSDSNICVRRNDSRDAIKKYSDENSRVIIDYKVVAKKNIDTSKLKLELLVDSGRKLDLRVGELEWNQFFPLMGSEKMLIGGDEQYISSYMPYDYIPYSMSNIGGDINTGITRPGSVSADVRKSEKTIDLKVSYTSGGVTYSRIVRVTI